MREMIAMLDGIGDLGSYARAAVSPSQGGNYGGGSSWASSFPTYPSSNGLAGGRGLADVLHEAVSGSQGGNYSGGSSWAPGLPTYPSSNGLAAYMAGMAPEERSMMRTVISPGSGELYQGGSSWASGLPLYPSSNGLAANLPSIPPRVQWRVFLKTKARELRQADELRRLYAGALALRTSLRPWCSGNQVLSNILDFDLRNPLWRASPLPAVVSDVRSLERAITSYAIRLRVMSSAYREYISRCTSVPPRLVRIANNVTRLVGLMT